MRGDPSQPCLPVVLPAWARRRGAEDLKAICIALAMQGDVKALRLCLERLCPRLFSRAGTALVLPRRDRAYPLPFQRLEAYMMEIE